MGDNCDWLFSGNVSCAGMPTHGGTVIGYCNVSCAGMPTHGGNCDLLL
jgi:hypothetical protein